MTLKKSSWYYKLVNYMWEYTTYSFCKFFWILVLSILLIVPFYIFALPTFIISYFSKEKLLLWMRAVVGFFTYIALWMIFSMIFVWFNRSIVNINSAAIVGYCLSLLILLIYLKEIWSNIHWKSNKPSLFSTYIKAKKQKICPIIKWED